MLSLVSLVCDCLLLRFSDNEVINIFGYFLFED